MLGGKIRERHDKSRMENFDNRAMFLVKTSSGGRVHILATACVHDFLIFVFQFCTVLFVLAGVKELYEFDTMEKTFRHWCSNRAELS